MADKLKYAGFSAQAVAAGCAVCIYRKIDGTEVDITGVFEDLAGWRSYVWADKVFVGVVSEFVRQKSEA